MEFDPNAYLESKGVSVPTPSVNTESEANVEETSFDANAYLAQNDPDYYKRIFTKESSLGDQLHDGFIGEIGALNDFFAAIMGEFQTSAVGVPIAAGLDYVYSKANLWNEGRILEDKIEKGIHTKEDLYKLVELDKNTSFKTSAVRADKGIRESAAFLNPSKNSDLFMDYYTSKISKQKNDEWKEVQKDLQNLKDKSVTGRALSWLGENILGIAKEVEVDTGLPSELGVAFTEMAMLKSNTIAKPIINIGGKVSSGTGLTGTIKRITGNSDLAQINKAIEARSKLGYDSKHLQEYKNAATFGKVTQTDKGIPFDFPPENFVKEALQSSTNRRFAKEARDVKTEEQAASINELASRGQQKLDNSYTTLIQMSLTTKLNKLFGKDKEAHNKVYDDIVDYLTWDSTMRGKRPTLTKVERQIYNDIFKPAMKDYNALIKKLHKAGKLEKDIIIDARKTGKVFPRRMLQKREGFFKNVLGDKFKINDPFGRRRTTADALSGRSYFTLFNPLTKQRQVIALDVNPNQIGGPTTTVLKATKNAKGEKVFVKDRALTELNRQGGGISKSGDKLGPLEVREATRKELRDQTKLQYVAESPAVLFDRLAELKQIERDLVFETNFKKSKYFKENAVKLKPGERAPEGFKKVTEDLTQSYKDLDKYYYKDRTAEILEDANRPRPKNVLTKVSDALVKNMMLNPIPHMHNELIHFYSTKGFMRTWSPKARALFKEDMMWAEKQVSEFGEVYREALRNNSSMMSTNIKNTTILDSIFRQNHKDFYSTPTSSSASFFAKADKIMNRQVGETYGRLSNFSQNSMWHTRDVMFMMLLKQKQRQYPNLTMKQQIQLVESHLPSYRIPIRVGEKVLGAQLSRVLSKILQNQSVVIFARYKHGMVSSGLNTLRDIMAPLDAPLRKGGLEKVADFIGAKDVAKGRTIKEQFKDGADSGLALASASLLIYPILDALFRELFNADDGYMRRAGILHVLDTSFKVGEGSKDPYALFQNLATINPTLTLGAELLLNTTFYNGREIYNVNDPAQYIARDVLKKLGTSIPLASQIVNADGPNERVLSRQIDFKIKTRDQARSEERRKKRRESRQRELELRRKYNLPEQ
jgi:hypothetical protein